MDKVYCTMTPGEAATVVIALAKYIEQLKLDISNLQFTIEQMKAGGASGAETK